MLENPMTSRSASRQHHQSARSQRILLNSSVFESSAKDADESSSDDLSIEFESVQLMSDTKRQTSIKPSEALHNQKI